MDKRVIFSINALNPMHCPGNGVFDELARNCAVENLIVKPEKCCFCFMDNEQVNIIQGLNDIPPNCDMLAQLYLEADGKWSASFYATFSLDSNRRVRTTSVRFEEANDASPQDIKEIQACCEKVWTKLTAIMEKDP